MKSSKRAHTWENSRGLCVKNGSQLVSIETADEYTFLKEQILVMNTSEYYIGLMNHSGGWIWISNNSKVNASKGKFPWGKGQPSGPSVNCICKCAKMYYEYDKNNNSFLDPVYDDIQCTTEAANIGYICERPVESTFKKSMFFRETKPCYFFLTRPLTAQISCGL